MQVIKVTYSLIFTVGKDIRKYQNKEFDSFTIALKEYKYFHTYYPDSFDNIDLKMTQYIDGKIVDSKTLINTKDAYDIVKINRGPF